MDYLNVDVDVLLLMMKLIVCSVFTALLVRVWSEDPFFEKNIIPDLRKEPGNTD